VYFSAENLFVVPTDFSHYREYESASKLGKQTAETILKNDPEEFYWTIQENRKMDIPNLATSIYGWTLVLRSRTSHRQQIVKIPCHSVSKFGRHQILWRPKPGSVVSNP
jgi:AmmeMemoRadiSam system protein B